MKKIAYDTMNIGDFVEVQGKQGRILEVSGNHCLVWLQEVVQKIPKEKISITVTIQEHLAYIAKEMEQFEENCL